ncbi:hypothetical protein [Streptomyces sp. NPDC057939]|uniref:hypothetical protein n=1 Tax=Streptomyces sp. NPDC057939 TaxID=3346284 RepID=UPI0036ECD89E
MARVDVDPGTLAWRHELPEGVLVSRDGAGSNSRLVEALCGPDAGRLTGWDAWSGQRRWERTEPTTHSVLDGCARDAALRRTDRCETYLVAGERIARVDPDTGEPHRVEGLRLPEGRIDRVAVQGGDRLLVLTAPTEGDCRATVMASAVTSGSGDAGRRQDVTWDQPQVARDAATGCRWDRTVPLDAGFRLVVPDARGAYLLDPCFGTLRPFTRLSPDECPLPDIEARTVVRARPERPRRARGGPAGAPGGPRARRGTGR